MVSSNGHDFKIVGQVLEVIMHWCQGYLNMMVYCGILFTKKINQIYQS